MLSDNFFIKSLINLVFDIKNLSSYYRYIKSLIGGIIGINNSNELCFTHHTIFAVNLLVKHLLLYIIKAVEVNYCLGHNPDCLILNAKVKPLDELNPTCIVGRPVK